jgi:hypothetical protein
MGIFNRLGIRFRELETHPENHDVLLQRFKERMKSGHPDVEMQIAYHSVFIKVPQKDHKWWSPELTVNIEEHNGGSQLRKVTGPNPGTFTLAMFVISGALVIFFFALMFAFSQIQLNTSPLISLLVIVGSVLIALLTILVLGWGRKKANPQMEIMNAFVREVLQNKP